MLNVMSFKMRAERTSCARHITLDWIVVLADTVNQFKNRLDKHWANYAVLYDYLVNYNGTGSLFVV